MSDSAYASLLHPNAAKDLYRSVTNKFEIAHGLLFNFNTSLNKLEKRGHFEEIVSKLMAAGKIGRRPRNLSPDLKITKEKAEELRRDGKIVEEWFIRTPEEEEIVKKMKEEWKRVYGNKNN